MNVEKKVKIDIYFMLKVDEKGAYILPVNNFGEKIENFEELEDILIDNKDRALLECIKNIKNDDFFISWDNEIKEVYFDENLEIIEYLEDNPRFVDENLKPIEWQKKGNKLSLLVSQLEDSEMYKTKIVLNNKIDDFLILSDNLVFSDGIIYILDIESDSFHTLKELIGVVEKKKIENFITLTIKHFENIEIEYKDYKVVEAGEFSPIPQLIIEKISQDNSLYLQVTLSVSDMNYKFLRENEIEKIAIIDEEKEKVFIRTLNIEKLTGAIEEIIKLLIKRQKTLKVRTSYYLDEDNLIIMQEKLAKDFILKDLLQLASKYKVVGTDKLKKYNIKGVKPKVVGKFTHSINFLEGEVELEIEGEKFSILDILSAYKNDSYITLSDGSSALINKKYIDKLERLFKNNDKDKIKLSFFDLPLVEELIEDKVYTQELKKSRSFFEGINNIKDAKYNIPKINATLREYQEYGYRWLCYLIDNNFGCCLADDMGLGKTLQAIAVLTRLHQEKNKKSLVIMPKSLVYNWESEIKKFSPKLKVGIYYGNLRNKQVIEKNEVILTTYGTVRNDIESIRKYKFDLLILDESQNIKNVNAQTTKAIMLLNGEGRIALSGTPIENNLSELYSLFRFLNPAMFGTLEEFNNYYAVPIQRDNDIEVIEELKKKVYPYILRRVKKEVLKDLPEKIEKTIYIEMNPEQKKLYDERRKYYYDMVNTQIKENGLGRTQFFILQALNELRQITSCPESRKDGVISSKREVLLNSIIDAVENGHKVLVFTNYLKSIDDICEDLKKNGINYLSMSGATKDRQQLVEKFQKEEKYKVFVMTLKTGGVGLNLTSADTIFIYDPWWNKTVENQAVDRAYRLGQDRTVFSYKLILKDSIEEKILQLQELKTKLLDSLISEDNTSLKVLTENDIEFILGK